jgi:hypothetical protein
MASRVGAAGFVWGFALFVAALPLGAPARAEEDPGAFCARRGNFDRVRPIPPTLVSQAREALGLSAAATDADLIRTTVFRCMDSAVWVCNHGANLPCAKADRSPVSRGADSWCKANPDAAVVPAYATGHDTIYAWKCTGTKAVATTAVPVDKRGFAADQWRPISK